MENTTEAPKAQSTRVELRDYFAAKAMQSLLIKSSVRHTNIFKRIKNILGFGNGYSDLTYSSSEVAREAYVMADEMLKNNTDK